MLEVTKGVISLFVTDGKNSRLGAMLAAARLNVVNRACLVPVVE